MIIATAVVPNPQGTIPSKLAAGGVFHMPGYTTEGPVRRIGGYGDWTVPRGGSAAVIPLSGTGVQAGMMSVRAGAPFNPYGWLPSGAGEGAYDPHDRNYKRIYGYLPYQEGSLRGAGDEPLTLEQKIAAEVIETARYQRKTEKWKLWLSGISTAALVTLTIAAIASGRSK